MKRTFFCNAATPLLAVLMMAGCNGTNKPQQAVETEPDTLMPEPPVEVIDTLLGCIGDDTSMNLIQLLTDDGDTIELDLDDQTDRQATLQPGNRVRVAVRREADSTLTVLSTHDAQ